MDHSETYLRFLTRLRFEIENNWKGQEGALASVARIAPGYLSQIKKGQRTPSIKVQERLANACGSSYASFVVNDTNAETNMSTKHMLIHIIEKLSVLESKINDCRDELKDIKK